jgi:hypothetical protein
MLIELNKSIVTTGGLAYRSEMCSHTFSTASSEWHKHWVDGRNPTAEQAGRCFLTAAARLAPR